MRLPEKINGKWLMGLSDDHLLDAEERLHQLFNAQDRRERKAKGDAYRLASGSAELLLTWDRWMRSNGAARARGLNPRVQKS